MENATCSVRKTLGLFCPIQFVLALVHFEVAWQDRTFKHTLVWLFFFGAKANQPQDIGLKFFKATVLKSNPVYLVSATTQLKSVWQRSQSTEPQITVNLTSHLRGRKQAFCKVFIVCGQLQPCNTTNRACNIWFLCELSVTQRQYKDAHRSNVSPA